MTKLQRQEQKYNQITNELETKKFTRAQLIHKIKESTTLPNVCDALKEM